MKKIFKKEKKKKKKAICSIFVDSTRDLKNMHAREEESFQSYAVKFVTGKRSLNKYQFQTLDFQIYIFM